MVSSNTDSAIGTNRGFVTETTIASFGRGTVGLPLPGFWGSVIAGALVVLSIGALSSALMLGCHVGTYENGAISFGAGAAIWMIITSIVAYWVGGWVVKRLSFGGGTLRGLVMWGLSIPLMMIIGAAISGAAGVAYAHMTHTTEQLANSTGAAYLYGGNVLVSFPGAWISFIVMGCGLIFSLVGAGMPVDTRIDQRNPAAVESPGVILR